MSVCCIPCGFKPWVLTFHGEGQRVFQAQLCHVGWKISIDSEDYDHIKIFFLWLGLSPFLK